MGKRSSSEPGKKGKQAVEKKGHGKSLKDVKKELKRVGQFLGRKPGSDEENGKEFSDEVFDESDKRKLSFFENFSRLDTNMF